MSASLQILVNAAIAGSARGAEISDYYCYGDVKCLGRIAEVDLIYPRPTTKPLERLSTYDRRGCEAFVGDCGLLPLVAGSFLLKHLVQRK